MRVKGFFVGKVAGEVRQITTGKQPMTAFLLESQGPKDKFPNRLKVIGYTDRMPAVSAGQIVGVTGEVSAEAYLSKTDNQPKAVLKLWAESTEPYGATAEASKITEADIPKSGGTSDDDNSIPF